MTPTKWCYPIGNLPRNSNWIVLQNVHNEAHQLSRDECRLPTIAQDTGDRIDALIGVVGSAGMVIAAHARSRHSPGHSLSTEGIAQ